MVSGGITKLDAFLPRICSPRIWLCHFWFLSASIQSLLQVSQPENHLHPLGNSIPFLKERVSFLLPSHVLECLGFFPSEHRSSLFSTTGWEDGLQSCKLEFGVLAVLFRIPHQRKPQTGAYEKTHRTKTTVIFLEPLSLIRYKRKKIPPISMSLFFRLIGTPLSWCWEASGSFLYPHPHCIWGLAASHENSAHLLKVVRDTEKDDSSSNNNQKIHLKKFQGRSICTNMDNL